MTSWNSTGGSICALQNGQQTGKAKESLCSVWCSTSSAIAGVAAERADWVVGDGGIVGTFSIVLNKHPPMM